MTFAFPWALGGLVLAGIPILLHLLARREPSTVMFPATRYLAQAAEHHKRRLQLQHFLLLLVRTLLVVALVLAASGPSWPSAGFGNHGPTAAVLILDNSLSSGTIAAGVPVLDGLKTAARAVVDRATSEDRLWLLTADGIARPGAPPVQRSRIDTAVATGRRADLGALVTLATEILDGQSLPGEVIVVSDLQRTAVVGLSRAPITVLRPSVPPPGNAGIGTLDVGSQPWGADGGTASLLVRGSGGPARPVTLVVGDRPPKQLLVPVGGVGTQRVTGVAPGWWTVKASLDADELRADDSRSATVRIAPAARVAWSASDQYLATAASVLAQNGRIVPGAEVGLGSLGSGGAVVTPPADPAQLGALNRALAARGSAWRFGDVALTAVNTDSGPWLGRARITRRHRLVFQGGAPTDVLVTAAGEPWVARSGRIVLVGSRMEPGWTALPLAAGFVPFLDALLNRAARGELIHLVAAPGDRVLMPDRVTMVSAGARQWTIEGGSAFRPADAGPHFLLAGRDTIGVLSVNPDPRESDLDRAGDSEVLAIWPNARVADLAAAGQAAFQAGARSDLRGPLLWAALLLAVVEVALASLRRGRR